MVVANYGESTVWVLLGNGDSTFQTQVTYPLEVTIRELLSLIRMATAILT
jgi:hypothetical protein